MGHERPLLGLRVLQTVSEVVRELLQMGAYFRFEKKKCHKIPTFIVSNAEMVGKLGGGLLISGRKVKGIKTAHPTVNASTHSIS